MADRKCPAREADEHSYGEAEGSGGCKQGHPKLDDTLLKNVLAWMKCLAMGELKKAAPRLGKHSAKRRPVARTNPGLNTPRDKHMPDTRPSIADVISSAFGVITRKISQGGQNYGCQRLPTYTTVLGGWPTLPRGTKHTLAAPPIAVFDGWERSAICNPQPECRS